MFTGLVEEIGGIREARRSGDSLRLTVDCSAILEDLRVGDSVSIEGACQTVVARDARGFAADTLAETLRKTSFGALRRGNRVNLERALSLGDRLGGHLVQGHVDGRGTVAAIRESGRNIYLDVRLEPPLLRYCIAEGSIAISGVSLTIAELLDDGVRLNIIPETWRRTTLADRKQGDPVNVELDVIARYVERLLGPWGSGKQSARGMDAEQLASWGYQR